jgi:hypothetical protein
MAKLKSKLPSVKKSNETENNQNNKEELVKSAQDGAVPDVDDEEGAVTNDSKHKCKSN